MARRSIHPQDQPPRAAPGAAPNAAPEAAEPAVSYLVEDDGDRRRLRAAVAVAVAVHALLLVVPSMQSQAVPVEEEPPPKLMVVQPVRFKPPEVKPEPPPEPKAVRVPIPDPDPLAPEPLRPLDDLRPVPVEVPTGDYVVEIPEAPPEPEINEPILVGGEVARPRGLHTPKPSYTEIARKARIEGPVILQLTLDRQGAVEEVQVLKGLPMGLTEASMKVVREWRYEPATLNGKPVPVYMVVTVHFNLG